MNVAELFRNAAQDRDHGANEIEGRLVSGLLGVRSSWALRDLELGAAELLRAQPSMANLRRLAGELLDARDLDLLERGLIERRRTLEDVGGRLAEHGAALLIDRDAVITISRSTAVRSLVAGVTAGGWLGRVVVLDGTASGHGVDQARELCADGVDAQSLPDGAMLEAFDEPASRLLIVVGADAVSNSRFINAQGTHLLLELGGALGVHRVLVADSGKNVRESDIDAVLESSRHHDEPGPGRSWPVFEGIPIELVDQRVTETGCFSC